MTYTATAAAAAPQPTSKGMLALIDNLAIVGGNQISPVSVSAFAAEQIQIMEKKADYVSTQVFPMPPAFTAAGNATENCDCWMEFPLTQDMVDLLGIQNNSGKQNITANLTWGTEDASVNLASGVTASFSGTLDLYSINFAAPLQGQAMPDFTKFADILNVASDQVMDSKTNVFDISYENWITRLILNVFVSPDNLDTSNSVGITTIKLQTGTGKEVLFNQDLSELIDENRKRFGPAWNTLYGTKGVYVIDFEQIRDYVNAADFASLRVVVETAAAPAAGVTADLWLQGLTNTDPAIPLFM